MDQFCNRIEARVTVGENVSVLLVARNPLVQEPQLSSLAREVQTVQSISQSFPSVDAPPVKEHSSLELSNSMGPRTEALEPIEYQRTEF